MALASLNITTLRNIPFCYIEPSQHFNVFYGANGSGKSSLLEAIYLLATGRSFRTSITDNVISWHQEGCTVYGQEQSLERSIGVSRYRNKTLEIKIQGERVTRLADLVRLLPIQVLDPLSLRLLETEPKTRRQFIDAGLFHVEQGFLSIWQRFKKILQQRNALLKTQPVSYAEMVGWDSELITTADLMHQSRWHYVKLLELEIKQILKELTLDFNLELDYFSGWAQEKDYAELLRLNFYQDKASGFTQWGPHRADICVRVQQQLAVEILSRGQQKIIVSALRVAQTRLIHRLAERQSIYLVDDISSELDMGYQQKLFAMLQQLQAQVFITLLQLPDWLLNLRQLPIKVFHVEQGSVKEQQ